MGYKVFYKNINLNYSVGKVRLRPWAEKRQQDMGIDDIFTEDVIYTESWSPQYNNRKTVKHWFQEWNTRGKVVIWEIKQFFHKGVIKTKHRQGYTI